MDSPVKGRLSMKKFDDPDIQSRILEIKHKISELAEEPLLLNREFYLMGLLTPLLDELGADPAVIVGGHAVELYTSGSYKTADIDLVMIRDDLAKGLFERLGFEREGRFYYVTELDVPIEIPDHRLAGSSDRVLKLNTPDGYCYVLGIEDLILDRLNRAEFWGDARSLEWARFLMVSQQDNVDFAYLREKANGEHPKLSELLEQTINWVKKNGS